MESFKKETQSEKYNMYAHKSAVQFLNAVYGSFPTIIYMNGDSIVKVINYRGIDEAEMVKFLKE